MNIAQYLREEGLAQGRAEGDAHRESDAGKGDGA